MIIVTKFYLLARCIVKIEGLGAGHIRCGPNLPFFQCVYLLMISYIFMISGAKASVKLSLFELAITFCDKVLAVSFCSLQLTACLLKRNVY